MYEREAERKNCEAHKIGDHIVRESNGRCARLGYGCVWDEMGYRRDGRSHDLRISDQNETIYTTLAWLMGMAHTCESVSRWKSAGGICSLWSNARHEYRLILRTHTRATPTCIKPKLSAPYGY